MAPDRMYYDVPQQSHYVLHSSRLLCSEYGKFLTDVLGLTDS